MERFSLDTDARGLLEPLLAGLHEAALRLPAGPALRVTVGEGAPGDLVLPAALLGGGAQPALLRSRIGRKRISPAFGGFLAGGECFRQAVHGDSHGSESS